MLKFRLPIIPMIILKFDWLMVNFVLGTISTMDIHVMELLAPSLVSYKKSVLDFLTCTFNA